MSEKDQKAEQKLAGKKHSIDSAIRALANKKVRFMEHKGLQMIDLERAEPLGNKSLGKMDFLIKKCGMRINMLTKGEYDKQFTRL